MTRFASQGRKACFFEKSSKKLLIILASACPDRFSQVSQEFFGSFFQKRTAVCHTRAPCLRLYCHLEC
jgi:hypothetical protein